MPKLRKAALLAAGIVILSGCMNLTQTLVIREDRTASYTLDVSLDMQPLLMLGNISEAFGNDEDGAGDKGDETQWQMEQLQKMRGEICDQEEMFDVEGSVNMEAEASSAVEGTEIHCHYRLSGHVDDFLNLDRLTQGLPFSHPGEEMLLDTDDNIPLRMEKLEENRIRITSRFNLEDWRDSETNPIGPFMNQYIFQDKKFRWQITAPVIIDTNGTLSEDGRTATWELPLSEVILGSEQEGAGSYEIYAVISYDKKTWYQGLLDWFGF